ncbi:MAG: DUF4981 domain-containing protein [Bacteroidales bacterium]|nr:DUF4981 domain-containing protein [Bacteroidales bacterium]
MKRIFSSVILFAAISTLASSQNNFSGKSIYSFLENTGVYELNQEEGHTPQVPYSSVSEALINDRGKSSAYISLNGPWKFYYSDTPEATPAGFYAVDFNDRKWAAISVPSNWEMQGFGDPLFRNVNTPFPPDPPDVPREYNPTGLYRKTFAIPSSWKNKEIFLRMEKTASASFVWINGRETGYNEGAQEPAEYNITEYIKPGKNTIAVLVTKYSDGYYLEDQDYWRLAGIFDDVWLYASPETHIFDWYSTTDFDETFTNARLNLSADIKNYSSVDVNGLVLKVRLYDREKKIIKEMISDNLTVRSSGKETVRLSSVIKEPEKWSSEKPNLYTLIFELSDPSGRTIEAISGRMGFRETEIRNQVFYLNGKPVKLNGINSHMQHPLLGHTMDEETIRKDLGLLKQFNINCVRTSHYPPVKRYLELADEYGMYIVDETGDEAHATEYVSRDPEWEAMYRDRARKMVLRDRNHPCILFWSAGNESGEGDNICAVIEEGKKYDSTRYWMYGGNDFSHPCEDIIGPRYPQLYELVTDVFLVPDTVDPRPSFLDEYLAVTGNGGGGLDDYWELFYRYPRSMGGAIWDFVSTGITQKIRSLRDSSVNKIRVNVMGRAKLVRGVTGNGIDLNGHDQWVEVYRDKALEINGDKLTLSLWVYPRSLSYSAGTLITKGNNQFGLHQTGSDSLEFYLMTRSKHNVRMALPENWDNNWHFVTAVYDGGGIFLTIDGKQSVRKPVRGNIKNTPFPVNIGRNAEVHGQETEVYICDAIIDQAGIFTEVIDAEVLRSPLPGIKRDAALWLDFEEMPEEGEFFSYGIGGRTYGTIWPDRRPQPEMWQIKKSAQPVTATPVSLEEKVFRITNRFLFTDLNELQCVWVVQADAETVETGEITTNLPPLESGIFVIPFSKPDNIDGREYRLLLSFRLKNKALWAEPGFEIAWEQYDLPWSGYSGNEENTPEGSFTIEDKEEQLSVSGNNFRYLFDKETGLLSSFQVSGKEMLKRGAELNVWRAPLANEIDEWSAWRSASPYRAQGQGGWQSSEWFAYGLDDLKSISESFSYEIIDKMHVEIYVRNIITPSAGRGAFMNQFVYRISGKGELVIDHTVIPNGSMPSWLPRIGLEWILDPSLENVEWYGRGPQENYPDRKSGYKTGIYRSTVKDMYEPYLIPQDYGLRTETRWVRMTDSNGTGIEFSGSSLFNFNSYPFTTENLTKAVYTYQLKKSEGITFNFDYATSGVGCTALSVFPEYRVTPQRYDFRVIVRPLDESFQSGRP